MLLWRGGRGGGRAAVAAAGAAAAVAAAAVAAAVVVVAAAAPVGAKDFIFGRGGMGIGFFLAVVEPGARFGLRRR